MLEELGYIPTEKYAKGAEIFAYCRRIAEHFDLYRDALLQTDVTRDSLGRDDFPLVIRTDRGDVMRARFVCLANGLLQKPKLPGIPGIERFRGHTFHTSRWDYDYTGGDPRQLDNCADKRVGIIGTGATAVQCVPHLAADVPSSSTSSSARRPRSDVRATGPPIRTGQPLQPGGSASACENFQILTAGGQPRRTWSTTRGPTSCASSR